MNDELFMLEAIEEAKKAYRKDEVPIGAVVVCGEEIIGRGYNRKETQFDPTAHAEILAIQEASRHLKAWRLTECTLYVTIEPCLMCMGALHQARIKRLVFGARDAKFGAAKSLYEVAQDERLNHQFEVTEGILEEDCRTLMASFFKAKRNKERCPSG
ncbi:tRNA adenosine(34) deaminase TadA [Guggenheimella bovis]